MKFKEKKGITLIALVVTIIILIILAGVSLNLIFGQYGIVTRAQEAKEKTKGEQLAEEIKLALTEIILESEINNEKLTNQIIKQKLENNSNLKGIVVNDKLEIQYKGYEFYIDNNNQLYIKGEAPAEILDDVATWLRMAGVEKPEQYSTSEIYANKQLMQKIMSSKKAVRYMLKSNTILEEVLKSDVAINEISFAGNTLGINIENQKIRTKLLSNETYLNNIKTLADKVPTLTSNIPSIIQSGMPEDLTNEWGTSRWFQAFDNDNTTYSASISVGNDSIGSWIGYDFGSPINVFQVTGKIRTTGYKIEYSDNNGTNEGDWTEVISKTSAGSNSGDEITEIINENVGAHRYWRLRATAGQQKPDWSFDVYELQFYGALDNHFDETTLSKAKTVLQKASVQMQNEDIDGNIFKNERILDFILENEEAMTYTVNNKELLNEMLKYDVMLNKVSLSKTALKFLMSNKEIRTKLLSNETYLNNIKTIADKVPTLKSNIPSIIQSGMLEDLTNEWGTTKWFQAFDDDNTTYSASISGGDNSIGTWIGYDFGSPINVFQVTGKIRMKGYKIEYSDNNGTNEGDWTEVISKTSVGSNSGDEITEIINENVGAHRYWRLRATAGQQVSNWSSLIYELQFYGIKN